MRVEYRLLGPLEADVDGRQARLGGPKQRAVLALLLCQPNTVVPASRLIDGLWGDAPPGSAANLVQGCVSGSPQGARQGGDRDSRGGVRAASLERRARPPAIRAARVRGQPGARAGRSVGRSRGLREALALWRGPALADIADEPSLEPPIPRLDELRLHALERRIEADLALGRHADVVDELERLVEEHPLRERTRALLMTALYRSGRQAEALEDGIATLSRSTSSTSSGSSRAPG